MHHSELTNTKGKISETQNLLRNIAKMVLKIHQLILPLHELLILLHNKGLAPNPVIGNRLLQLLENPEQVPPALGRLSHLSQLRLSTEQLPRQSHGAIEHPRRNVGGFRQRQPLLGLEKQPELLAPPDHRVRRQLPEVLLQRHAPLLHELLLLHHLALHRALVRPHRDEEPAIRQRQPFRERHHVTESPPDGELGTDAAVFREVDERGDEVGVEGGGARDEGGGGGEVLLLLRIGDGDVEVVAGAESGGGGLDGLVVAVGIEGGEDCIGVRGRVKERVERGIRALRRRRTVVMVNGGAVVVVVEDQRVHYLVVLGGVENVMLLVVGIVIHHFG